MSKPKDCIPVADAKALQKNWNDNQAKDIEKAMGSKDVCAVTFNIDQLQEFINYVKSESTKQNIEKPGIRVYFAANDKLDDKKATVFLNATENDGGDSANNYEIDPLNRGNGGYPPNAY